MGGGNLAILEFFHPACADAPLRQRRIEIFLKKIAPMHQSAKSGVLNFFRNRCRFRLFLLIFAPLRQSRNNYFFIIGILDAQLCGFSSCLAYFI